MERVRDGFFRRTLRNTASYPTMTSNDAYTANLLLNPTKESIPNALHPLIHKSFLRAINSPSSSFTIALSGGSLPSFLSTLPESFTAAKIDPQWDKWHIILADERLVPSTDGDSNLRAIRASFLNKVPIPSGQIHGIDESLLSRASPATIAAEYQKRVIDPLISAGNWHGKKMVLDCVLLGFGPDGHTCSLFQNHPLLFEKKLLVVGIENSPKPPDKRITLTRPVLDELSRDVIFVGTGASKRPVLEATFEDGIGTREGGLGYLEYEVTLANPALYPCGMIQPKEGQLTWIVDADAAQSLGLPSLEQYLIGVNTKLNLEL